MDFATSYFLLSPSAFGSPSHNAGSRHVLCGLDENIWLRPSKAFSQKKGEAAHIRTQIQLIFAHRPPLKSHSDSHTDDNSSLHSDIGLQLAQFPSREGR